MWKQLLRSAALLAGASLLILLIVLTVGQAEVHAQPADCTDVIDNLFGAIQPGRCAVVGPGNACYANDDITAKPASLRFSRQGHIVPILDLTSLRTHASTGAAILVADTDRGPIKIMAMGGSQITPSSRQVFTLRRTNTGLVCEKTPSGLLLQTDSGERGRVTINGVSVEIGSTALISAEGEVLFDQDPRIDRREGRRNPDAPLCSGFDSQCDFGDSSCPLNERLVWGPFCREDAYANISPGLYRMTLYGRGAVRAGATDYNVTRQTFGFGSHDFSLPGSFTFCWPGLEPGGTGFETIVHSRSKNARVDQITLEYLGADCNANLNSSRPNMMTVTNVEGDVTVRAAGVVRRPVPGQAVRIHYEGSTPAVVENPHPAGGILESPLIQWLTFDPDGLPEVDSGYDDYTPPPPDPVPASDPVASFEQVGLSSDDYYGEADGLVLEVAARDPGVGRNNGAGIESVRFRVYDPGKDLVFERTERIPAYCAFGGNGPCSEFIFRDNDNVWPSGVPMTEGAHTFEARVMTENGATTTIRTTLELWPQIESPEPDDRSGPDIGGMDFDPIWEDGRLCMYESIVGWTSIYDDSGVDYATFYYRFHPEIGTPTFWVTAPMERVDDYTFSVQMGEFESGTLEYTIVATDGVGNESQTSYRSVDTIVCATVD